MDPYLHVTFVRGEGFKVDDIDNLDKYAQQKSKLKMSLKGKLSIVQSIKRLFSWLSHSLSVIWSTHLKKND